MAEPGFRDDFKRNFVTGIAALFPILVTLFLFTWLYRQLEVTIGQGTNGVIEEVLVRNEGVFRALFPGAGVGLSLDERRAYAQEHFPSFVGVVFGLFLAAVVVYLVGKMLRVYIGRQAMDRVNRFFERFPVIKAVYPHARQVGDLIFGSAGRRKFSRVVAVQYPRRGMYTIGFQTGEGVASLSERAGKELASVFIPTSPTPVTGLVIMVPVEEIVRLDITVDEAFRYCLTAGMLVAGGRARALTQARNAAQAPVALDGEPEEGARPAAEQAPGGAAQP
jgi:uncharacterized membrane protein